MSNIIGNFINRNYEIIFFTTCKLIFIVFLVNICGRIFENEVYFQYFGASVIASVLILTLQDIVNIIFITKYKMNNINNHLLIFLISTIILCSLAFMSSLKTLLVLFVLLCLLIGVIFFDFEKIEK